MQVDSNNHSVFLMYYYLVLAVKYRCKVIDNTISERLTTVGAPIEVVGKYIESQGEKV